MNFYKHYIGDYQRDTGHLSLTEHGAYRLMLDAFYATGKPLPADKRALYRLVRAGSRQDRLAVDSVAAQFWETADGGLVNRRACVEIARAEKQAEVNRQIALAREERRRLQRQLAPGGSFAGGNGGLAGCQGDHASAEVSEVCKVHDTQVIYGLQPFMVTNRATSGCTGMGTTVVAAACAPGAPTGSPDGIGGSDHGAGDGGICRRAGEGAGMDGVCQAAGVAVSAGNVPVPRGGDDGVAGEVVGGACDGDAGMVPDAAAGAAVFAGRSGGEGVSAGGADGVRRVERVFGVLASFYGARFADMWRGVDPGAVKAQWAHALSDVSDEELRTGLAACRGRVWPPTLPEFLALCRPEPDAERAFAVAQVQAGRRAWGGDVWPDRSLYWAAVAFGWYDLRVMSWQQAAGRWTRVWRECRLKEGALPPVPVCRAVLPQPGRGVTDRETALRRLAALKRRLVSGEKSCGKRALHGVRDEGVAVAGSADVPGAAGLCGMTGACVKE